MKSLSRSPRRGIALVMVLSIILLVTILVVGMTVAMRMERSASHHHLERTRAELFAQAGVDYGQALLRGATDTNRFWVSAPGQILASETNTFGRPDTVIALSSGLTNSTDTNIAVDLNRFDWNRSERLLNPGGTNLTVRWIYVEKDGSHSDTTNNDVVGRFAFWIDDDSTRVNINTAGRRTGAASMLASPSQISLEAVPGVTNLFALTNFTSTNMFRTTAEVFNDNAELSHSRYLLTAYSQDPDVNPWHEPRRVLTTFADQAGNRPFLNILKNITPTPDPGVLDNLVNTGLGDTGVSGVYSNIMSSLLRTNWPYAPDSSFATKFGVTGAEQLALDIIEYVRTTESIYTWIQPIVGTATTNSFDFFPATTPLTDPNLTTSTLIGTVRRPMITQVHVYCSTNTNSVGYDGTLYAEVFRPSGYATNSLDAWLYTEIESLPGTFTNVTIEPITIAAEYTTYTNSSFSIPANPGTSPTNVTVRLALLTTNSAVIANTLDVAPLASADRIAWPMGTNQTGTAWINDPRLNKLSANWITSPVGGDVAPTNRTPTFPTYPDSDGSTNSLFFPPPNSVVGSVGELGYVVTGISTNAPWRSVRLRPGSSVNSNTVPDWALLDLFSAPILPGSATLEARYLPGNHTVAGRINVNAAVRQPAASFSRTNALNALLTNTAVANLPVAIENLLATTNLATGGIDFSDGQPRFLSVGQIAELAGFSDTGEASEEVIRQVASLASVRSGVFTITSLGQAVQIGPNGQLRVTGERMVRVTVERQLTSTGAVRFRTLGWSEIYP